MEIIHDFMTFIIFPIKCKLDLVITHQRECPNQVIIDYNQSLLP